MINVPSGAARRTVIRKKKKRRQRQRQKRKKDKDKATGRTVIRKKVENPAAAPSNME